MRRWWPAFVREMEPPAPFAVPCGCGHTLRGERRRRHQVVRCPACGKPVFVLPRSPWPVSPQPDDKPGPAHSRSWRMPLVAGACALALLLALFFALLPRLARPRAARAPGEVGPTADVVRQREAGRQALAEGNFRLAFGRLDAALTLAEQRPGGLPPEEMRRLIQLQRQSDLLARLLTRKLEEIIQQGARVRDEAEWQAQFADYRGKTVIFDDVVVRDAGGRPRLGFYVVRAGDGKARVVLEDLKLLGELPLASARRLVFGARLAACSREKGGAWVVRFEPDSGVLLTDPGAATACGLYPNDPEVAEVLRRQDEWVRGLPALRPAAP